MRNVLIVTQNSALLESATKVLAKLDERFAILTAANDQEAAELLASHAVGFIILHVSACAETNSLPISFHQQLLSLPSVVITNGDPTDIRECFKLGDSGIILQEPIEDQALTIALYKQLKSNHKSFVPETTLFSLLQLVHLQHKTCIIKIRSMHHEGILAFDRGELVNALSDNLVPEAATRSILSWKDPDVEIYDVASQFKRMIFTPLSHILIEATDSYRLEHANNAHAHSFNSALTNPDPTFVAHGTNADIEQTVLDISSPLVLQERHNAMTTTDINVVLGEAMTISGAVAIALVDMTSGMTMATLGNTTLDLDAAAAGNSEVVKAKLNTMKEMGLKGEIEDILITLTSQYHLIRPLGSDGTVFLYLVLNRAQANLGMARRVLAKVESGLKV